MATPRGESGLVWPYNLGDMIGSYVVVPSREKCFVSPHPENRGNLDRKGSSHRWHSFAQVGQRLSVVPSEEAHDSRTLRQGIFGSSGFHLHLRSSSERLLQICLEVHATSGEHTSRKDGMASVSARSPVGDKRGGVQMEARLQRVDERDAEGGALLGDAMVREIRRTASWRVLSLHR